MIFEGKKVNVLIFNQCDLLIVRVLFVAYELIQLIQSTHPSEE